MPPTIEGIIRRGILPLRPISLRQFTMEVGYTKSEHVYDWSLLFAVNRKILDPVTKRFYFVPDPVKLTVQEAPPRDVVIPYHPFEKLGTRTIATAGEFYVPSADVAAMAEGQTFRLIELYNVELVSKGPDWAVGRFAGDGLVQGSRKLQWGRARYADHPGAGARRALQGGRDGQPRQPEDAIRLRGAVVQGAQGGRDSPVPEVWLRPGSTAPTGASWPTTDRLAAGDHGAYMPVKNDVVWAIFCLDDPLSHIS